MKALSKFLSVLTLALVAGSAMPAHALEVEYDYPDQASIESRAVGAYHQFNLMPAPMMMAPKIAEVITFDTKSDKLSPANVAKVKHVAMMLKSPMFVGKKVVVNGYTDNVGKDAPNQRLSYHRALTVVHALVAQGVPAASLSAQGQGKANPVADNATPAGRAANRRVTFTVVCDPR